MTPFFAFFTFLNAFWIMAFIAIPFSVTYGEENASNTEKYAAAPKSINWKKLVIIASSLAVLVTIALKLIIG